MLDGRIRSAFTMTEPEVASSDATNMEATAVVDGDEVVINGRKWWSTGVGHPDCRLLVFMGLSTPPGADPDADRHRRHTMVLVPRDAPGVKVERLLSTMGIQDEPFGHGEVSFTDVRVPAGNVLLGPGRAFEIAQGRLGPGRVHHCMRLIGLAEMALEHAIRRGRSRTAFGKPLVNLGGNRERIADARIAIDQARLLVLNAAWKLDVGGARERAFGGQPDQGGGAEHGAAGDRLRDADPRWRRAVRRLPALGGVDLGARAAARRRPRRGAPRGGRPDRARQARSDGRVLVTGGASGLGAALVEAFEARGDDVLVCDVNEPAPAVEPVETQFLRLDVRSDDDWAAALRWVEEHWGGLDVLVNNAGVAGGGRVDVATLDEWQWITEINLFGVVRGTRTFVPMFKRAAVRPDRQRRLARRAGAPGGHGLLQRGQGRRGGVHRDDRPRARGVRRARRTWSARRTSAPT